MNKIIVVGHPQSGLERVHELLLTCGMAQAQPSRREGFTPEQISATLLKAHGAVPVQQVRSAEELQQIAIAPVWQGLALDLVLANMEQPLWGWADVQAVYLLDYWKAQDPQTMFVLVYDAPQTALTRYAPEHLETDPEALQARVNTWLAYNAALLSFHLRNTERSLLVHADQVQASAPHYVQQLSARMNASLQLPGVTQSQHSISEMDADMPAVGDAVEGEAADIAHACDHATLQTTLEGSALSQWLAQHLLQEHPEAQELYAQLQAAATMPWRAQQSGQPLLAADGVTQQRYQAWTAFVAQQTAMQQSAVRLAQLDKTLQVRQEQLLHSHRQLEQLQQAGLGDQHRLQEQALQLSTNTAALQSSEQENRLLLEQLHKVQEALESHYLKSKQQKEALAELPKVQAALKTAQDKAAKQQQKEAQLLKELQQAAAKTASAGLEKENEMLLSQLHKVQEELERYYLENRQLKAGSTRKAYYGAADRIKQQLSYRLGATMIAKSRSVGGWLRMPFALNAEVKRFKQDQAMRANQKLPSLSQYNDAHEAERVKQHLSYRLGARMIANSKTLGGWVAMPWALLGEAKGFRKNRLSR